MQRDIITVPVGLFKPLSFDWDIDWRGQGVGETTSGVSQVVYNAFPRWVGSPQILLTGGNIPLWRAIRAALQGRKNVLRVTMYDIAFGRLQTNAPEAWADQGIPFLSDVLFSSGTGFELAPYVILSQAASAGDEVIYVDITPSGIAPIQGQIMSIDDLPFVVIHAADQGSNIYALTIQTPMRADADVDTPVMMNGTGLFELTDERSGLPVYDYSRTARPTIGLQEWVR